MLAWRISKYADLSGRGGLAVSGRWHNRPQLIVYSAEHPSTAYKEVLHHVGGQAALLPEDYKMLKINIPDHLAINSVDPADLEPNWNDAVSGKNVCRPIGDLWLRSHSTPLLRVPSAAHPNYFNILINPVVREAAEDIAIIETISQPFPSFS